MSARWLLPFLLTFSAIVRADVYHVIIDKQEKKAENRWSLSQWIDQRDRMRMMDLWLALHSPSPYEFYLGGEYQLGSTASATTYNANGGKVYFGAYASIFGLEGQLQSHLSEWAALFHLRIFGLHVQATNITLHGGVRSRKDPTAFLNPMFGLSATLYLFKHFGIGGMYRRYLSALQNTAGIEEGGHRFEGEAFIDFSFLRIYGQLYTEWLDRIAGPGTGNRDRTGLAFGARAFF